MRLVLPQKPKARRPPDKQLFFEPSTAKRRLENQTAFLYLSVTYNMTLQIILLPF